MAIEIVDLPINSMVIFHSYVSLPEGNVVKTIINHPSLINSNKNDNDNVVVYYCFNVLTTFIIIMIIIINRLPVLSA